MRWKNNNANTWVFHCSENVQHEFSILNAISSIFVAAVVVVVFIVALCVCVSLFLSHSLSLSPCRSRDNTNMNWIGSEDYSIAHTMLMNSRLIEIGF